MKYSLTPDVATLGKNRLAKTAGWLTVYHADETTGEYIVASYEFLMKDTGLPAHGYLDAPTEPPPGSAIVRSPDRKTWQHVPDHRGETVFNTLTREPLTVSELGDYPTQTTPQKPTSEFDVWDGEKWVTDVTAQHAAAVAQANARKSAALDDAAEITAAWRAELALGIISDSDKARLITWMTYIQDVKSVDTSRTPDIVFPPKPGLS